MSPMELWCNEAQERYVLAVSSSAVPLFTQIARAGAAARSPWSGDRRHRLLVFTIRCSTTTRSTWPIEVLLGKAPRMTRDVRSVAAPRQQFDTGGLDLREAAYRVLRLPACCRQDLSHHYRGPHGGDSSAAIAVGPWQVPVSDVAVTLAVPLRPCGRAMAMGERTPVAVLNARPRDDWPSLKRSPHPGCRHRFTLAGAAVGQLDGRVRRARRRRLPLRRPCTPWARNFAPRSESRFPSARTPCP